MLALSLEGFRLTVSLVRGGPTFHLPLSDICLNLPPARGTYPDRQAYLPL